MKSKYVSINNKIQGGEPCIKGTRIPIYAIYNMNLGGDPVRFLARIYDLKVEQVKAAIRFYKTYMNNK